MPAMRPPPLRFPGGWSRPTRLAVAFGPALVVLVVGALAFLSAQRLRESRIAAEESHVTVELLERVVSRVKDAETGERGFILTGDERYLTPYHAALRTLPERLEQLRHLARTGPVDPAQLARLEALLAEKLEDLRTTIHLRRTQGMGPALAWIEQDRGKRIMDALRAQVDEMEADQRRMLEAREATEQRRVLVLLLVILGGTALAFVLAVSANTLLDRYATGQERTARELAERNEELQSLAVELEVQAEELATAGAEREDLLDRERVAHASAEAARREQALLARASVVLASSLDYETTVQSFAELATETIADYCVVDLVEESGLVRRVAASHRDPARQDLVERLLHYPFRPDKAEVVARILRAGEAELIPEVPEALIETIAHDAEHLRVLRELGPRSVVSVPLVARDRVLGAITLVSTAPDRQYDSADLALARQLAQRAAAAIENARLYRDAVAANQVKTDFLAVMSHELRTPLTAVIGYTTLLRDEVSGPINEKQRTQLERIEASAWHQLGMIEEILTFSRIQVGKERVEREPVDIAALVRDTAALVEPLARNKDLDYRVQVPDPPVQVSTDPRKVRQILMNLIENAIKFTRQGVVEVSARVDEDAVVIQVRDTGIGIPAEAHDGIFRPFVQIEAPLTREYGGTGLGLSVTRELARLLGGDVGVESEPGAGSTFTVRLPLEE